MPGENLEMEDPGQRLWGEGRPPCLRERGVKTIEPHMGYGSSPGLSGLWQNILQSRSGLEELLLLWSGLVELLLLRSGLIESLWVESGLVELRLLLVPFFHRADRRMILMLWSEVSGTQDKLIQTNIQIITGSTTWLPVHKCRYYRVFWSFQYFMSGKWKKSSVWTWVGLHFLEQLNRQIIRE